MLLTTTENLLRSVSKMALEAGGPVAHLGYSRQDSRASNQGGHYRITASVK
jgi:hypothetical protein